MNGNLVAPKRAVHLARQFLSHWPLAVTLTVLTLAFFFTPAALAERSQQTVPIPTATPTETPVPTITPTETPVPPTETNTPVPPTNTPVPPTNTPAPPTNTPVPGAPPAPTNTPAPTATNTPSPIPSPSPTNTATPTAKVPVTFAMGLEMDAPFGAMPGDIVEILFTATNPSNQTASNVRIRSQLPTELILVAAAADDNGTATLEEETGGLTVVLFDWPTLGPGQSIQATLTVEIAADVQPGMVIDNLAVAFADNGAPATAAVSIGLPPAVLPSFN